MVSNPGSTDQSEEFGIRYVDGLYSYAMMLTRNCTEAEELVQETYVRALQAIDRLREDRNLRSWLYTTLRNLWLSHCRTLHTASSQPDMEGGENPTDSPLGNLRDSCEISVGAENPERVRLAIRMLTTDFREIIQLREFAELSYQEISVILGCPVGTVMSLLGRARAKLRALLIKLHLEHDHLERATECLTALI